MKSIKTIVFFSVFFLCLSLGASSTIKIGKDLQKALSDESISDEQFLDIVLFQTVQHQQEAPSVASMDIDKDGEIYNIVVDETETIKEQYQELEEVRQADVLYRNEERNHSRQNIWRAMITTIKNDQIDSYVNENSLASMMITMKVKKGKIDQIIKILPQEVKTIDSFPEIVYDSADYMSATNIDPWALDYNRHGNNIGIFFQDEGCPTEQYLVFLPPNWTPTYIDRYKYEMLYEGDGQLNHNLLNLGVLRAVSPESYIYCSGNIGETWTPDDYLDGSPGNPPVYIASNSWHIKYSKDADYQVYCEAWDDFIYEKLITTVFSASNYGTDTPPTDTSRYVGCPGKAANVITVGAYDDTNMTQASFSNFLDGFAEKPEVMAPGVNISANGVTDSGTSFSTPHVSAFLADLMGAYTWLKYRPHLAKAAILASTTDAIATNSNFSSYPNLETCGYGGVDFRSIYYEGSVKYWEGEASNWSSWDSSDGTTDNKVEHTFSATASKKVKIAIAWLNTGTYISSQEPNHKIGIDFDLEAYNPSGTQIASSASRSNPEEVVSFVATTTGTYKVKIKKYARYDNDPELNIYLGLWVNKDD